MPDYYKHVYTQWYALFTPICMYTVYIIYLLKMSCYVPVLFQQTKYIN